MTTSPGSSQCTTERTEHAPHRAPYLLFILSVSLLAVGAFAYGRLVPLSEEQRRILELFDLVLCGVFLLDFVASLVRAEDRWGYMVRWGWLDLLSSIPAVGPLRLARAGRIVRILRVLRAVRLGRVLVRTLGRERAQAGLAGAAVLAIVVLLVASFAILEFERGPESNIRTGEDALWWGVATMTTVGYGDRYPVTTEGRVVGAALMVVGVGLLSVLTAFLASWFLKPEEDQVERGLGEVLREVEALRAELRTMRGPSPS